MWLKGVVSMFSKSTAHIKAYNTMALESNAYLPVCKTDEYVDAVSEKFKNEISDFFDTLEKSEKCWYVSLSGNANNNGETPETAWDSLDALNKNSDKLNPGDTVFFKRGDVFRGFINAKSGVSYGAYGAGEKPRIYGSMRNHINDDWHETENGLWTVETEFPADVGNIIFDEGKMVGVKRLKKEDIADRFDYWCDHDDENRIYIKLDSHPKEFFKSIEIAFNLWMFRIDDRSYDINIENLCFKYCGGHGIRATYSKNITVKGCEFEFIGGCYLSGFKDGTVRYGNAIEFMSGCQNILVEKCFFSQIYDSAITHQGCGYYCAENIVFKNNLIEYCGMGSIEYWLGEGSKCKNVFYKNNIMRFAGYGFGGIQRPDKEMTAHIQSNGKCFNEAENFHIEGNIFELSTFDIINVQSKVNTLPILSHNTYIQSRDGRIGSYAEYTNCVCSKESEDIVKQYWGDSSAKVSFL